MSKKIDILDLEYASKGRDVDISEPILSYLELKYDLNIVRKCSVQNWQYYLLKYRPQMVFIANGVGALPHFQIVKTAHYLGIKVVTHFSEGDFTENPEAVRTFFWGYNKDRKLYEDLHLEWSQRNIHLINTYIGKYENIKLSGAVGFDKYKLLKDQFLTKNVLLKKYHKTQFNKIIGIAGWGFDEYIEDNQLLKEYTENIRQSKDLVKKIIEDAIIANPDILFILKYHPLVLDKSSSEFHNIDNYSNVLKLQTEEAIFDVINVCDIWGAYESTTAMEAWLIGDKPTFLIQPIENDFIRSRISDGSTKIRNSDNLQEFIDEFYNTGRVRSFDDLEPVRKNIIERIIQWSDGKNHQRAAEYIYELYKAPANRKIKINSFLIYIYGRFIYKKITRQIRRLLRLPLYFDGRFNDTERGEWHQIYKQAVRKFHDFN